MGDGGRRQAGASPAGAAAVTAASRARFAEVVREEPVDVALACLLVAVEVDPELDPGPWLAELDALAWEVPTGPPPHEALRAVLGRFRGFEEDYDDLRSSLLHEVLRRRRGLPLLLCVVWCEVARRCGWQAACLGRPGHVLALVEGVVVDPFHGGVPREVEPEPVLDGNDLLLRVLTNVRALAERQGPSLDAVRTRLWATELSLLLPRHPLDLRRERGELLVRSGSYLEGALELEDYAEVVPSAEAADRARVTARLARARLN